MKQITNQKIMITEFSHIHFRKQ